MQIRQPKGTHDTRHSQLSRRLLGIALMLTLVTPMTHAADAPDRPRQKNYIGLGAGFYNAEIGAGSDEQAVFGRYFYGRSLTGRLSLELGLNRFKDIKSRNSLDATQQATVAHGWVGDISVGPSYPLASRLDIYARVGWSLQHSSSNTRGSEDSTNQGLGSVGFTLKFYDDAPIRLEYSRFKGNHVVRNVEQFSLQIVRFF